MRYRQCCCADAVAAVVSFLLPLLMLLPLLVRLLSTFCCL
jgi:hypothetical protein